jgi:CheY-like chemotaxis protein
MIKEGRTSKVVVMDKNMPGMTGNTATEKIKALGYGGPIIGFSGEGAKNIFESKTW